MFDPHVIDKRRWHLLASSILVSLSIVAMIVSAILSGIPLRLDPAATGSETIRAAGFAIPIAAAVAMAFVWWSFRATPSAFRHSACAIAVIAHNLLVLLGFQALMGMLAGWQADALFFVAVLAVIGLSTQDAIAIFSRVRENAAMRRRESQEMAITRSIYESIVPTLVARLCALFALIAITIVGGPAMIPFAATLLVGVIVVTYSATFTAVLLLTI